MNVSAVFVRRPIATSLLMAAVALFGVIAYAGLPVSDLPNVDFPTLSVGAGLPGADPETIASSIASPLERQFSAIAGLDAMTSSSALGTSSVTLQFDLDRSIDGAAVDVQTAIAEAMTLLPPGMPSAPTFRKVNPADQAIFVIALSSDTRPLSEVDDWAETLVAPQVSAVNGVAQVNVLGGQKFAVRVQVDPEQMHAHGVGINEVEQLLQNWNVNLPTGQLFGPTRTFTLAASGQLMNAAAFRPAILRFHNGAPIRLQQVATVIDSVEDTRSASWLFDPDRARRAILVSIMKQPGSNTLAVIDAIKALLPDITRRLPPSIHLIQGTDRAISIRASFTDIRITMAVTMGLVVLVIFLFLRSVWATAIPALALPFSMLGTFVVMRLLHFSLNNLSLMAVILSFGFVVDDAIVMLENIMRHVEAGAEPLQATLDGAREVGFTILSMTASLAAVFIPVLFMSGILGRLFREFAVTITSAVIISGVVSVTLTPMLCSRILRRRTGASNGHPPQGRVFTAIAGGYARSLRLALRHRAAVLALFVIVLAATVQMFRIVPKGFIPDQDDDSINVMLRAAQGTAFDEMAGNVQTVGNIVRTNPNLQRAVAFLGNGPGGAGAQNTARIILRMKPRADRLSTAQEIVLATRPMVSRFPGFRAFVTLPPAFQVGGRQGDNSYSVTLRSPDTGQLYDLAGRFQQAIAALPTVQDVSSDLEIRSPRVRLYIDRDKSAALALDPAQISSTLYSSFGPLWSSTIYGDTAQYRVLLELDPRYQTSVDALQHLTFKTPAGRIVPLESVLRVQQDVSPQTVNHAGQLPAVAVSFGLRPGVSLGDAVGQIRALAASTLPAAMAVDFEGTAKAFEQSMSNLGLLLFVAIGVVYIVLGMLYESFVQPLTILSGLPAAGLGALLTLWVFGDELNVYSFVGLIMLVGIVKKNAIMQIDVALQAERERGSSASDAIYEGCIVRFRPIMMTTMAALLGALPIALGWGAGGEARRPMGLSIVGGLLVSQVVTLYLTPIVYTYAAALTRSRTPVRV
ncbi:MAG TPA: efflux RND transporter permease subunit, partial [Vicinamibacterales bacterium]|nr:efflux RND transporter permease subunit [Vicinamibacterales bacterium]